MSASNLSYRGFLLRFRNLAKIALDNYGIKDYELKFINYRGNGLYRVDVKGKNNVSIPQGRYTLRLHQPNYMNPIYISSEMEWLFALNEAGLDVPRPYKNQDGQWITVADIGFEVPQARNCTLISWMEGRFVKKPRPKHFKSLGKIVGRMHQQSVHWKKPNGFKRPHWDWEGLFGDGFDYGVPAKEARAAIPKKHQEIFQRTLNLVEEAQNQLGKGRKVFGLIHADLAIGENMVFRAGEALVFDFDDCGFGYWAFDLGVVLANYMLDFEFPQHEMQEALIEGYQETSPFTDSNLEYLDLFIAARLAQLMFFYQGSAVLRPEVVNEANEEIASCAELLKQLLKRLA